MSSTVRTITIAEKKELLAIDPDKIDYKLLSGMFAKRLNTPSRFNPEDRLKLNKNEYYNKEEIETSVGRLMYNKMLMEKHFISFLGYINETITGKVQRTIDSKIGNAALERRIPIPTAMNETEYDNECALILKEYIDRKEVFSKQLVDFISGSFTEKTLIPNDAIIKRKQELFKQYAKELSEGDLIVALKIENELVDMAKKELAGDPGMDLYESGARGSIENNYKNNNIMRGPIYNPIEAKWDIVENSFVEGLSKKDIPSFGNQIVAGAYPKAIGTADAGYKSKQLIAIGQTITAAPKGSDCGSKRTLSIKLTDKNINMFKYRYIIENGQFILLTESTIKKYLNKTVELRSPLYCVTQKLCNKCIGDLPYMMGVENVGLLITRLASTRLNLKLKKMHNTTTSLYRISSLDEIFL